jgi:hypothetical protein
MRATYTILSLPDALCQGFATARLLTPCAHSHEQAKLKQHRLVIARRLLKLVHLTARYVHQASLCRAGSGTCAKKVCQNPKCFCVCTQRGPAFVNAAHCIGTHNLQGCGCTTPAWHQGKMQSVEHAHFIPCS